MTTEIKFPTLYKQTTSGKVQQWQVSVNGNMVTTTYGLTDGKHQTTTDEIRDGKNLGRSNATTPETQAQAQAQQSYDGKIKEGYVEDIKLAQVTKNTLAGVEPMLAFPIEKKEKYAVFPALSQPKLDGLRMLAVITNGKVQLWSRTQKEYNTLPHIVAELESIYGDEEYLVLDGEAYNHSYKHDFNQIIHLVKRDDVDPKHTNVQYHIYDVVAAGTYLKRTALLKKLESAKYCKRVETIAVNSREELDEYQAKCVENGYEGCMYRNPEGEYENKRSKNLLKVKTFADAEFTIVSVEEGSGKLMNAVGAFHCELNDGSGRTFKATPAVTLETKAVMWTHRKDYIGKTATVQYQNFTPDGIPRFPIWKALREGNE